MTRDDLHAEISRLRAQLEYQQKEHEAALRQHDENRAALLNLLEDLQDSHNQVERISREWTNAFDAVSDPIFLHDRDFRIMRANLAYANASGMNIKDVIGKRYWEVFPKLDGPLPGCATHMEKKVGAAAEDVVTVEPDTAYSSRAYAINDEQNNYLYSVHILENITEQKKSKIALQESELKYREVYENSSECIFLLDVTPNGRFMFAGLNPAEEQAIGFTSDKVVGKYVDEALPPNLARQVTENYRRCVETGSIISYDELLDLPVGLRYFHTVLIPVRTNTGVIYRIIGMARDITDTKEAEENLRLANTVVENSPTVLFRWKATKGWPVEYVSENVAQQFGYTPEELCTGRIPFADIIFPDDRSRVENEVVQHSSGGTRHFTQEYRVITPDGTVRWVDDRTAIARDENGNITHYEGVLIDQTERKEAEMALKESESKFRTIFEGVFDGILVVDPETRQFHTGNRRVCEMFGYSWDELKHLNVESLPPPEAVPFAEEQFVRQLKGEIRLSTDMPMMRKDGSVFYADITSAPVTLNDKSYLLGLIRDVTQQRQAAAALKRSETNLAEAQRIAHLGSWKYDITSNKLAWSDEVYRIFEIDQKKFCASYEAFLAAIHPEDRDYVNRNYSDHLKKRTPYDIVHRLLFKDGRVKYVHERCETTYDDGVALYSIGTVQDITAHKLADIALQRVNRALKALSAGNEVVVRSTDEDMLLEEMCRMIVEVGGYRLAWVGYAEQDENKTVKPKAYYGSNKGFLEGAHFSWSENEYGGEPTGMAIRTGKLQVIRNVATDSGYIPWREEALQRGFVSVLALPVCDGDGDCFGSLTIETSEVDAFDEEEVRLLQELATDLSYGIINHRVRKERTQTAERLRESLVDTIRAIALTVEKRDPYTAGHQNKVAKLCVAIGKALGLNEDFIEGLHLGATIHDIGKIYIPAEILNRPGKLSDPEFEMIKSHASVGYDIIKDVKFPWPVAQIILQHHERLDGSGYPHGLKDAEIILEARILAVADVVEAMSSHRPYRPSRGTHEALEEIKKHSGSKYDPAVVDACLQLFQDHKFSFES